MLGSEERKTTTRGLEILDTLLVSAMEKLINPLRGNAHLKMTGLLVVFFFLFKSLNWYRFGSSNLKRPPLELSGTFLAEYNETKTGTIVQHFKNLSRQEGFRNVLNANKNKVLAYFFLLEFVPRRGDNE